MKRQHSTWKKWIAAALSLSLLAAALAVLLGGGTVAYPALSPSTRHDEPPPLPSQGRLKGAFDVPESMR